MRKVLHIINAEFYSGAERVQDHLAACLPKYGYKVDFACLKPELFPQAAKADKDAIHLFPMQGRMDLRPAWHIARFIKSQETSLIHTHTPRAALIGSLAALLSGRKLVHHLHSPTQADTEAGLRNRINAFIEHVTTAGTERFIAVSEHTATWYRQTHNKADRVTVVPNGVPAQGPLEERTLSEDQWTIGTVALFRPRKGLETLLEAFAALLAKGHKGKLLAVGNFETEEYRQTILSLAAKLGIESRIEWTGFTNNVPAALRRMDCFVLPSLYGEGLPMVILEAMALGTPVVATDVEGASEAIRSGTDGLLVPPGAVADMSTAMQNILSNPTQWDSMRRSAHARHREHFSDDSMARGVAGVYDEVLDR